MSTDEILRVADSVVHDLGNLLAVIAGQTSLLEPLVRADPEGRESVAEIRQSVGGCIARLHELAAAIRQATAAPTVLGRPIVLLVEPETAVSDRVAAFLKTAGYQVVAMATTTEALYRAADLTVDLAIVADRGAGPSAVALIDQLRTRQPRLAALVIADGATAALPASTEAPTVWLSSPLAMDRLAGAVKQLLHEP